MKKDFETLYNEIETNNESNLKEIWQQARKEKRIATIIVIIALVICAISGIKMITTMKSGYMVNGMSKIVILPVITVLTIIITIVLFSRKQAKYNQIFKESIVNSLFGNFLNELDYIPKKQMPQNVYNEGRYKEYYNRYYSDDYAEGKIDEKYDIKIAEVHTVEESTRTDSDGHTHTDRTTKFHGIFAKINIGKSIQNDLIIKQNGIFGGKNKLEMDSQEFEKYFDVNSESKIIGMQLLTHDVMDSLIGFRKLLQKPYDISIYEDTMYLRVHTGAMFEAKINKDTVIDKKSVEKYYNALDFIYTLSKQLIKVIEETEI